MTPDELRKLADAWPYSEDEQLLYRLAPDLARLCAELGEALHDLHNEGWFAAWSDDSRVVQINAALARLEALEKP